MRYLLVILLCAAGCGGAAATNGDGGDLSDATPADAVSADDGTTACDPHAPPALDPGWIGGRCQTATDCGYADAVCLGDADGFPGGLCTLACDRLCPDQTGAGMTATFCVDGAGPLAGTGMCVAQCDYAQSAQSGCRSCWGCNHTSRFNEPATVKDTCAPGTGTIPPPQGPCYDEARARGLTFLPAANPDEHPDGYPNLTCHFEAPLRLVSPIHGVHFYYYEDSDGWSAEPSLLIDCSLALALDDAAAQLQAKGVVAVQHWGTYSCRTMNTGSPNDSLSMHALGLAIDMRAFKTEDGTTYTVVDDFEGDLSYNASSCRFPYTPQTQKGQWLLDVVYGWCDAQVFNMILTPNYNTIHVDHFHCDLTPGSHFLGVVGVIPGGAPADGLAPRSAGE
jgi:hypothetical protein